MLGIREVLALLCPALALPCGGAALQGRDGYGHASAEAQTVKAENCEIGKTANGVYLGEEKM